MKKLKLVFASIVATFFLASSPALATPTVKDPPQVAELSPSFSSWVANLFN